MLAGAIHRFAKQPQIELRQADAAALPFPNGAFDTANIANAVHCLPDVDGALRDVSRVLKPGGTLALNVLLYPRGVWPFKAIAKRINDWGMRKGILHTPYEADDIKQRLTKTGFVVGGGSCTIGAVMGGVASTTDGRRCLRGGAWVSRGRATFGGSTVEETTAGGDWT